MTEEIIQRMNALYHKSKDSGLTEGEQEEYQSLKSQYISSIRSNLRSQLNHIDIENEDGTISNLGEKYGKKKPD